ncbi:MAG: 3-oxoacyl-[acyl-carrier-protein] reductase [Candidatus Izemoplasmatales bacterium]|nr:3-oxoacyl-[acyl-carrier-protein] reductase [Candidatus Izemoplasmatales bacterium]
MILKHQVAIVTGGSGGIGQELVRAMARQGAHVVFTYHKAEPQAQALCAQLLQESCSVTAKQLDVGDFTAVHSFVSEVFSDLGRIDILVNNSGITKDGLLMRMSEADFDAVIRTNLKGSWNMVKAVMPFMSKARYGRIINMASIAGITGNAGQANYAASKAGLIGLTKSVAKEYARRGITCNAIAPGLIDTQMSMDLPEEVKAKYLEHIPVGRLGEAKEVAELVVFLAGHSAYITGQVIHIDGGMVMG